MSNYSNSNSFFPSSFPMNSYRRVMNEIHVLFVEHDQFNCINTKGLLEICEYRVSHVQAAAEAIFMLSNELDFDLVIANINSPDAQGFKLLHAAVEMDIPIILTSVQDDVVSAMKAIEIGATLFIKMPTTLDTLACLWQHVAREKTRATERERERLHMMANYLVPRDMDRRRYPHEEINGVVGGNGMVVMKGRGDYGNGYYKGKRVEEEYDSDSDVNCSNYGRVKRKVCTEWTQELHEKFIEAVQELGEGRCFPKEILELMNVPGLTRMQVASHLQKCRNENWRSPGERKATLGANASSGTGASKQRRFGSMPRILKSLSDYEGYDQASGDGQGSGSYTESEAGTQDTMFNETYVANHVTYHQHYGALVTHAQNTVHPSGFRHLPSVDGFFASDTDCMILNFSDPPQEFGGMEHPDQSSSRAFQNFEAGTYVPEKANSMDSTSQWSGSENSNFGSEDSNTKEN